MQRYSNLFGKTIKSTSSKSYKSKNAQLLIQAGYINQVMSGVYAYLPLGIRVIRKIEKIVREEMDKIGEEILLPALAPKEIWEKTGRLNTVDVLMQVTPANEVAKSKHNSEYVLNPTHEDILTNMAKHYMPSYKDLPYAVYQIQNKFRNEPRAKSGLLRAREFIMKDLYSFHKDKEDLYQYYEKAKEAYWKVYERLGLKDYTYLTAASGGDFTENYSHEFQIRCKNGEDTIFYVKSTKEAFNKEIAPSKAPKLEEVNEKLLDIQLKETPGVKTVNQLAKFLNQPVHKTVKTLIYVADEKNFYAVVLRGDYEVNEIKLKKVTKAKTIRLANDKEIEDLTGAKVGYAGLINLPKEVKIIADEAIENLKNFELGGNKTDYHYINVNWDRDLPKPKVFYDIKVAKKGDLYPQTNEIYEVFRASEAGNIFPLETKFSKALNYYYTNKEGKQKLVYMGSYGIGISRLMGIIAEIFNDGKGLIWPKQVAPFDIHFITLEEEYHPKAQELISQLESAGFEVLWDDRKEARAGEKFKDADLIGIPIRVVLSKRSLEKGGVEVKVRGKETLELVNEKNLPTYLKRL